MDAGTYLESSDPTLSLFDYTINTQTLLVMERKPSNLACQHSADTPETIPVIQTGATVGKKTATAKGVTPSTKITPTSQRCAAWLSKKCSRSDCKTVCALAAHLIGV